MKYTAGTQMLSVPSQLCDFGWNNLPSPHSRRIHTMCASEDCENWDSHCCRWLANSWLPINVSDHSAQLSVKSSNLKIHDCNSEELSSLSLIMSFCLLFLSENKPAIRFPTLISLFSIFSLWCSGKFLQLYIPSFHCLNYITHSF